MQNKSVISFTGGERGDDVREREGLPVNKRWALNAGSPMSDTFHHVSGGRGLPLYSHTCKGRCAEEAC